MSANQYVTKLETQIAEQGDQLRERGFESAIYIFFSYDLVNSTKYKTINSGQWALVTSRFYELVEDGIKKRISQARLWKYVGDELLLYKRLDSVSGLRDCVPKAYEVLLDVIKRIHGEFPDTKTILSVKAVVWCAKAARVAPQDVKDLRDEPVQNIVLVKPGDDAQGQLDFLGSDIDVGFRIAKFAARRRLVVSADLAYLLFKERVDVESIDEKLRIVSYEQLKGIWGERRYPIIWYEDHWDRIASTFVYDERFESSIIEGLANSRQHDIADLKGVLDDLDKKDQIEKLWAEIRELQPDPEKKAVASELTQARSVEVHCVAVCFNSEGRILVAKRAANKRRLPEKWEFGCGQLRMGESFEECLKRSYKEDFDIELNFGSGLKPITTYHIDDQDERRKLPGIIFVAEVVNHQRARSIRHGEIDWIEPDQAAEYNESDCVPNFQHTIHVALASRNTPRLRS